MGRRTDFPLYIFVTFSNKDMPSVGRRRVQACEGRVSEIGKSVQQIEVNSTMNATAIQEVCVRVDRLSKLLESFISKLGETRASVEETRTAEQCVSVIPDRLWAQEVSDANQSVTVEDSSGVCVEMMIPNESNSEESELSISENTLLREECKDKEEEEKSELRISENIVIEETNSEVKEVCEEDEKQIAGVDIAILVILNIEQVGGYEDVPQVELTIFGCEGSKVFNRGKYMSGGDDSVQKTKSCHITRTWDLDQASVQVGGSRSREEDLLDRGVECEDELKRGVVTRRKRRKLVVTKMRS